MSEQEKEFTVKFSQIAKYILGVERRLNDLNERFNNRPELQQLDIMQNALAKIEERLNDRSHVVETSPEAVNTPSQLDAEEEQPSLRKSFKTQLIFDRSDSRAILLEALSIAQERLIIVCPWLSQNSIDTDLIGRFQDCLQRDCCIEIGWGYLGDRANIGKGWLYKALEDLRQLEIEYPEQFKLKLIGTHEKFLVCDRSFALLGSHNLLASGIGSLERETGIHTTDPQIIQGLRDRFDDTVVQELGELDENQTVDSANCDIEVTQMAVLSSQSESIYENFDIELDVDDSLDADEQAGALTVEEFLSRYNSKERDFAGVVLARVDLTGKNLASDALNLSGANLTNAKLEKIKLDSVNLAGANLKCACLKEAQLHHTKLMGANLESANLYKANLYGTKLAKANLIKANLSEVNLSLNVCVELNGANLSGANLSKSYLRKALLSEVNFSDANLSRANLLEANLGSANLQRVKLSQAVYNNTTIFPLGFNPTNAGAYLIAPNTSIPKANLANFDLSGINLTGANLTEANLTGANLSSTDLSEANLSKANLHQADLQGAKLLQVNLEGAILSEVKLSSANLTAANLVGANLIQANLKGANLTAADLSQANLKNTSLHGANFSGAILAHVNLVGVTFQGNLSGADLTGANLCGANLSHAKLNGANLTSADLRGANLEQANLEKANLKDAKIGGANLNGAKLNGAIMPDGKTIEIKEQVL